jgi:glutathione S-transferase
MPRFTPRIPVLPDAAAGLKAIAQDRLRWLDCMFGAGPYLCGERFSAADIWLYVWLDFGLKVNQPFDRNLPHVEPWFARVAARPSAARSRQLLK